MWDAESVIKTRQNPIQPDDAAGVDRLASAMKEKLAKKTEEGFSGWDSPNICSVDYLATLLVSAVHKGDPVDVANYCMMLFNRNAESAVLATAAAQQGVGVLLSQSDKETIRNAITAPREEGYPPCDYCDAELNYEPWHGSGMFNGKVSRHIHACDDCRNLLPGHDQSAYTDLATNPGRQSNDEENALGHLLIADGPCGKTVATSWEGSDWPQEERAEWIIDKVNRGLTVRRDIRYPYDVPLKHCQGQCDCRKLSGEE